MKQSNAIERFLLVSVAAGFIFLKLYGLQAAISDENIYFYDAFLMTRGFLPYRDFFFAHPPLHLLPGYLLTLAAGGFHLVPMKMLPVLATGITSLCIYSITRKSAGILAAFVACSLFLFSHDVLRASSHWTGINWSVAFMTGGLFAAWRGRTVAGGILLGLGVCTGFYIAPAALAVLALLLIKNVREGGRFFLAAAGTWLAVNGICVYIGGHAYIDSVYLFHLDKPPMPGSGLAQSLPPMLFHNFFPLTAPLLFVPFLLYGIGRRQFAAARNSLKEFLDPTRHPMISLGIWCAAIWIAGLVFLSLLSRVFHFYFLILFPVGAICAGLAVAAVIQLIRQCQPVPTAVALLTISIILSGIWFYPRIEHRLGYFTGNLGKTMTYPPPAMPIAALQDSGITDLIWKSERTIGKRYTGIRYYLWHESRGFDVPSGIAEVLKRSAGPGEAIFGDSTSTPLIALMAGLPIADHMADTNVMRFRCGLPPVKDLVVDLKNAMERDHERLTWIVIHPNRGIAILPEFRQFLEKHFRIYQQFPSRFHGTYLLLRRSDAAR